MYEYKKPHFFSFSGRATVGEFWSSFFTSLFGAFATTIGLCIVLTIALPMEVEELSPIVMQACCAGNLIWFLHIIAISRRRLRDAGFTAKSYLWLLLPGFGMLIFVARRLCARSVDNM